MNELQVFDDLLDYYANKPVIRALIQLVPHGIGSAINVFIEKRISEIQKNRLRTFFDKLANGKIDLNQELIQREDFLHCYFKTLKAAINTYRREKIQMFAMLIASATRNDSFSNIDEYEEYLSILDELSYRELEVLSILDKHHSGYIAENPEGEGKKGFWPEFVNDIVTRFKIDEDEIKGILTRLSRTGLYAIDVGMVFGNRGNRGELTTMYYKLKNFITD